MNHRLLRRLALQLVMLTLIATLCSGWPSLAAPLAANYALPNGRFFTDANGRSGAGSTGYAVVNSYWAANTNVRFYDEFNARGLNQTGYPAGRAFMLDGFATQIFQKVVFQWRPEVNTVYYINVFDLMHDRGLDTQLNAVYQIPPLGDWSGDNGLPWNQIVQRHLAMLNGYPALQTAYNAVPDPVTQYGLPQSGVVDYGPFYAVRLQRAVFQLWKIDQPGIAHTGQVLIANGGDVAKAIGLFAPENITPLNEPTWNDHFLVLTPGRNSNASGNSLTVTGDASLSNATFGWQVLDYKRSDVLKSGQASAASTQGWARFSFVADISGLQSGSFYLRLYVPDSAGNYTNIVEVPFTHNITPPTTTAVQVDTSSGIFVDDRSTPVEVVRSYYNAINRKEYVRAYSYWNGNNPTPYPQFEQGFNDTTAAELYIGQITEGAAAGSTYYGVPVAVVATNSGGNAQVFAGCFVVRWPQPLNFGAPPFTPMHIYSATIQSVPAGTNVDTVMAQGCQQSGGPQPGVQVVIPQVIDRNDISANRFIDNRSTAEDVLRSYYNAVNRKEYVRAYAYWDREGTSASSQPPAYPQFAQGFADTTSVQLRTGNVTGDPGAGTITYAVPVTLVAKHTDNSTHTYVGCFLVRQARPINFGAPPFVPMGIDQATLQEVPSNANTTALMAQACH